MNLYQKIQETKAGKHAVALGDVRYHCGHSLGEKRCNELAAAEAFLEALALTELKAREPWAAELAEKLEPPPPRGGKE